MKRKISVLLILCMVLSVFSGCLTGYAIGDETPRESYVDVTEEHWAYPWVMFMTSNHYIHGYPASENGGVDMYKPDQWITRAEVATILNFMLKPQGNMTETFVDMSEDDWHYDYISRAVATGYMSGYGDGTMKPNAYITREEASSIVYRAFKIEKYKNVTDFLDSDEISDWAYEAVMSLADIGIIVGYTGEVEDERYVDPKVNIKRAEIASLLANADKFYPPSVTLSDARVTYDRVSGGKVAFDMFPKNTSDILTTKITADNGNKFTVTYTVDGVTKTVTPDEFAATKVTTEQLENLNVVLNFDPVSKDTTVIITVEVTDHDQEGYPEGLVVGGRTYEAFFDVDETPSRPIDGGGGGTKYHLVTYMIPGVTENEAPTERVASGQTPAKENIPVPTSGNIGEVYFWTDTDGNHVNPDFVVITSDTVFYADITDIDRVIIALKAYQSMPDTYDPALTAPPEDYATVNALSSNETAGFHSDSTSTTHDKAHNFKNDIVPNDLWWNNDMLEVIVTNDNNHLLDSDKDYDNIVAGKVLKPIYDDVARYVIDYSDEFDLVEINSFTKLEYVKFFRAMVKTIDAAAKNAAKAYWDARQANSKDETAAYNEFKQLAVLNAASSLITAMDDEGVSNGALGGVGGLALGYVQALYDSVDSPAGTLRTELSTMYAAAADYAAFETAVETYIASNYIYTK